MKEMNKEMKKYIKAIKQLDIGVIAVYFSALGGENPQADIESTMFNDWFDEYELERHGGGTFWQKTAYCEGIKFYALYEAEELNEKDKEEIKEKLYEEIEAL